MANENKPTADFPEGSAACNFLKGYNCAQSVFAAHAEKFGLTRECALRLSAPLGGGVGRMRNVCGAFTACAMILGLKAASANPDKDSKKNIYAETQKLAEEFKKLNGSIICSKLLDASDARKTEPTPDSRTEEYYAKRPCLKVVENADALIKDFLSK